MKILFVDDEERRMETYVDEFKEQNFEVVFMSDIDAAVDFFDKNPNAIDLAILDVMMPIGNKINEKDAEFGMRTGIFLHRRIRGKNSSLPIIILTNVSDQELEDRISQISNSYFLQKENYLPYELVDKVRELLEIS